MKIDRAGIGQDQAKSDKIGQDRAGIGQDRSDKIEPGSDKIGQDRTRSIGQDRAGIGQDRSDKIEPGSDKIGPASILRPVVVLEPHRGVVSLFILRPQRNKHFVCFLPL